MKRRHPVVPPFATQGKQGRQGTPSPPLCFVHLRILKGLQERCVHLHILIDLKYLCFQHLRGGSEVRILQDLAASDKWLVVSRNEEGGYTSLCDNWVPGGGFW